MCISHHILKFNETPRLSSSNPMTLLPTMMCWHLLPVEFVTSFVSCDNHDNNFIYYSAFHMFYKNIE